MIASPLRRTGGSRHGSKAVARRSIAMKIENDDETERNANREARASLALLSSPVRSRVPFSPRKRPPIVPTRKESTVPSLNTTQLNELYSNCIKLSTENRINAKNTWNLSLIDHIDDIIDNQGDNFQVASCTLDASVKIYSSRVDSVHVDTYKVWGGLTRTGRGPREEEEEKEEKEEEGDEPKVRKPKARTGAATLERNPDALILKKLDLEFSIDPLFRKTSAAFDEGGARGLLLNHLHTHGACELIFDSRDTPSLLSPESIATSNEPIPHDDLRDLLLSSVNGDASAINDLTLCPRYDAFVHQRGQGIAVKKEEISINVSDDVSFDDFVDEGHDAELDSMMNRLSLGTDGGERGLVDATQPCDDFSYFDETKLKNWTGPAHWKRFTAPKTTTTTTTTTADDEEIVEKTKKKRTVVQIDFADTSTKVNAKVAFAVGRSKHTLTDAAIQKQTVAATTLPTDVKYGVKSLTQLFLLPKWRIGHGKRHDVQPSEDSGSHGQDWYDYSNANDAVNYAPDVLRDDDDIGGFDDDSDVGVEDQATEAAVQALADMNIGDNLVDQPLMPQQVEVRYNRVEKKVDVKALKDSIWQSLEHEGVSDKGTTTSFQSVVNRLPSLLQNNNPEAVSVPFCFICLLHLANEHGLSLSGKSDLSDFSVCKL